MLPRAAYRPPIGLAVKTVVCVRASADDSHHFYFYVSPPRNHKHLPNLFQHVGAFHKTNLISSPYIKPSFFCIQRIFCLCFKLTFLAYKPHTFHDLLKLHIHSLTFSVVHSVASFDLLDALPTQRPGTPSSISSGEDASVRAAQARIDTRLDTKLY